MYSVNFLLTNETTSINIFKLICELYGNPNDKNQTFIKNTDVYNRYTLRLDKFQYQDLKRWILNQGLDFESNFSVYYEHFHVFCDIFGEYHEGNVYKDEFCNYDIFYSEGKYHKEFQQNDDQSIKQKMYKEKYNLMDYEKYCFSLSENTIGESNILDSIKKEFEKFIIKIERIFNNTNYNKAKVEIVLFSNTYLNSCHRVIFSAHKDDLLLTTLVEIILSIFDKFLENDDSKNILSLENPETVSYTLLLNGQQLEDLKSIVLPFGINFDAYFCIDYKDKQKENCFDYHEGVFYVDECGHIDFFYINGKYFDNFNSNTHLYLSDYEIKKKYSIGNDQKYLFSISIDDIGDIEIKDAIIDLFKKQILELSNIFK